jgi:exopolysaccharide production protein ExoZ
MAERKTIPGVQYLRGLAALGVALCHYGMAFNNKRLADLFSYGQLGVLVFFLISGFIIVYSLTNAGYRPSQFWRFLIKRSIRIDPSYYATIILTLLLFKVLSEIPSFKGAAIPFVAQQFLAHVLYIVPFTNYSFYNHIFWTLCVEFQFYLLVGLLYFAVDSRTYRIMFLLLFCASCLVNSKIDYYLVFTYAPVFCLGMSLVDVVNTRSKYRYAIPALFIVIIALRFSPLTCIVLLLCALAIIYVDWFNKPMYLLGEISYSLYLTHTLTAIIINGLLKRLGVDLSHNQLFWLFIQVAAAIVFARVFYRLIEKHSLRLSKKIFYKRNSEQQ